MPYSEPYSTLLEGIATRLRDASGPFAQSDQVRLWVDEALDEVAPSNELQQELARSVPIALVCDAGATVVDDDSDADIEAQDVRVWFAAHGPTIEAMVTGDGDEYWGACALRHWVFTRLSDRAWSLSGWESLRLVDIRPVAVRGVGRAIWRATLTTRRPQEV